MARTTTVAPTRTSRATVPPAPPLSSSSGSPLFPEAPGPGSYGSNVISVGELLAQARAATLNNAATKAEPEQATVAGANELIRVIYGRRRIGAQITLVAFDSSGAMLLRCVWCKGPIDAIESVQINDADLPAGVTSTNYLGAASQSVDSTLSTALALQGKSYTDTLNGIAYSVVRVPAAAADGFPQITATVRGLKVRRVSLEAITFNGTSAFGQVAHGAQNTVNEDFEIIVGAIATDWTPAAEQNLLSKWNAASNLRSYRFALKTTGALLLEVSTNGTAVVSFSSTATIGAANGSLLWLRARFQKTDGANSRAKFATSLDGMNWTALGTDVTGAIVAAIYAGTEPLRLAAISGGGYFGGSIVAAKMTSASKTVCDVVAFEATENVASWIDASGASWSLTNTTTPNSRAWSRDPVDCLCDFIASPTYGAAARAHMGGARYAYAVTSMQIGSPAESYAQLDLTIDQAMPVDEWIDVLRDYAYSFVIPEGDTYYIVRDWDDPATFAFDESNVAENSLTYRKRAAEDAPTVVQITYTDVSGTRWRDYPAPPTFADGVLGGTVPRRMSQISKPGLTRFSEANRYQVQRLNKGLLGDLTVSFRAFDQAAAVRKGDLVTLTHPIGFSAKKFRVLNISAVEPGRWQVTAQEHDAAMYSTTVQSGPSVVDTVLPSPAEPPTVESIAAAPEIYQIQTGRWASRLRVTWDDAGAAYPFVDRYAVTILEGGVTAVEGPVFVPASALEYATGPLKESTSYRARVQVETSIGVIGDSAESADVLVDGKDFAPGDVVSISGIEIAGEVRLEWTPGEDFDVTATELRYGTTSATWGTATLLDRVPAPSNHYATKTIPPGTWRIFAKMLDSIKTAEYPYGQESPAAATVDITVTSDAGAFIAASYAFTSPLLWHMSANASGGWVTDFGDTWTALFGSVTLNSRTNPLSSYHTAGSSGLITEPFDAGLALTGDWYVGIEYENLDATAAVPYIEVTETGPEATKAISNTTNATPIVVTTSAAHGYANGDEVEITGVTGNTNANGRRLVASVTTYTFALQDLFGVNVAGNGTHGGTSPTSSRWGWSLFQAITVKATARYARARLITAGAMIVSSLGEARCNVVTRQEGGTVLTTPATVVFANRYNKAVAVSATAIGAQLAAYVDNIEVDGARGVGVGQALLFNGSTDYVDISDSTALRLTTALTIEAWFKVIAVTGTTQGIIRKDTESGTRYMWGIQLHANGKLMATYYNGIEFSIFGLISPAVDRWMHGALTINGTLMTMLLDGIIQGTLTISGTQNPPTGRMSVGFNPPWVGGTPGQHIEPYAGRIDEVRVWNVARTQAQIQAAMGAPAVGNESGLVGLWHFDSLSGTTAYDSQTNVTQNNGTVSGAKWRPLNGMDVYSFDDAGLVSWPTAWGFTGV